MLGGKEQVLGGTQVRVLGGKQVQVRVCRQVQVRVCRQVWERVCKVQERDDEVLGDVRGEPRGGRERGGLRRLHDLHDCMSNFDHVRRF